MTKDEARRLITEAGIEMIPHFKRALELEEQMSDALEAYVKRERELNAVEGLIPFMKSGGLTPEEQYDCFEASCVAAGIDPNDRYLDFFRASFESLKATREERELLTENDLGAVL